MIERDNQLEQTQITDTGLINGCDSIRVDALIDKSKAFEKSSNGNRNLGIF